MALKQEQATLKNTVDKENHLIDNLKSVLDIVHKLTDASLGLSLGQIAQMFLKLQVCT